MIVEEVQGESKSWVSTGKVVLRELEGGDKRRRTEVTRVVGSPDPTISQLRCCRILA